MNFIDMNISAALIILMIILIRKTFINKINHKIIMIMWIIPLLRLTLPFSDTFEYSIFNLFYHIKKSAISMNITNSTMQYTNIINSINDVNVSLTNQYDFITIIWVTGIFIFSLYFIMEIFHSIKVIKASKTIILSNFSETNDFVVKINLKRQVQIKVSDIVKLPVSFGMFKPVILFPKSFDFNNDELLKHIIIHEYMHIKYFHFIIKIFSVILLCIFWFNPAVWLLYFYINRDIEILCDNHVIEFIGYDQREKYASNLVFMLPEKKEKNYDLKVYNNFVKNSTKERICSIMKIKNITAFSTFSAIVIALSTSYVFATSSTIRNGNELNESDITIINEVYDDTNTVTEIPTLELDISEIKEYIKRESRTSSYLDIDGYKYVSSTVSPSEITISLKENGYTYTGTLYLDACVRDKETGNYIGYYSGRLYR